MYNQPYFIPGYFASTAPSMMRGVMGNTLGNTMRGAGLAAQGASRGLGLFGRLGSSIQTLKNVNWGGLITNASKTLNVVNQAIPLVKQVGPMVNNMKSMLRIASIFKDETDNKPSKKGKAAANYNNSNHNEQSYSSSDINNDTYNNSNNSYDGAPTFFINS